jgi:hypothetical protein
MTVNFSKFSFPSVENPHASSLTEGIRAEPVDRGFVIVTLKAAGSQIDVEALRVFARALRASASDTGFVEVTAFRQVRPDELGGAVPFDQAICDRILDDVKTRQATQSDRFPGLKMVTGILEQNAIADWVMLLEFQSPEQALAAAQDWARGNDDFAALTLNAESHTVNAFKNMMRYASVSRDPDVIQFFNLFPSPGNLDVLWQAWQDALPWFLEVGEIRSSFPLLALDPTQPLLLVNYAHCDSVKHFFRGTAFDPLFIEVLKTCYAERGVTSPMPFFCKIVSV